MKIESRNSKLVNVLTRAGYAPLLTKVKGKGTSDPWRLPANVNSFVVTNHL